MKKHISERQFFDNSLSKKPFQGHQKQGRQTFLKRMQTQFYNCEDPNQEVYKYVERSNEKLRSILKLGFKVHKISMEEEDLCLFCFSLLQAEAKFPLKIFTNTAIDNENEENDEYSKDLWMETQVLITPTTMSDEQLRFQLIIEEFFMHSLLPSLKDFIKKKICWSYMITEEYNDEIVIDEFKKVVIDQANQEFERLFAQ